MCPNCECLTFVIDQEFKIKIEEVNSKRMAKERKNFSAFRTIGL
jgi:hypothetical protein